MIKKWKNIIYLLCTVVVLISSPIIVVAYEQGVDVNDSISDFRYTRVGDYIAITGYGGDSEDVIVPSEINGIPVTTIGYEAFRGSKKMVKIQIPESVTSIGNHAFYDCSALASVEIPESVIIIGDRAFCGCSELESVKISGSVISIEDYTFALCKKLKSIEIPKSVIRINEGAFYNCSDLANVQILDGVTLIGEGAFKGCKGLTSIEIPNSVTRIEKEAFSGCCGLEYIEIPEGTTTIGERTFYDCASLKWVKIPTSVNNIKSKESFGNVIICGENNSYAEEYAKNTEKRFCTGKDNMYVYAEVEKQRDYSKSRRENIVDVACFNFGNQVAEDVNVTVDFSDIVQIIDTGNKICLDDIGALEEKKGVVRVKVYPDLDEDTIGEDILENISMYLEGKNIADQVISMPLTFDIDSVGLNAPFMINIGDPWVSGDMYKLSGPEQENGKYGYLGVNTLDDIYINLDIYDEGYTLVAKYSEKEEKIEIEKDMKDFYYYTCLRVIGCMRVYPKDIPYVYINVNNLSSIPFALSYTPSSEICKEHIKININDRNSIFLKSFVEVVQDDTGAYVIKANIVNDGFCTAKDVKATIVISEEIQIEDDPLKTVGDIQKNEQKQVSWKVDVPDEWQNIETNITIKLSGTDVEQEFDKKVVFENEYDTGVFYKKLPTKYDQINDLTCVYSPMKTEENEAQGDSATDMEIVTSGGVGTTLTIETYGANFELIGSYSTTIKYENEYNYVRTSIFTDDCLCYRIVADDSCTIKDINFYI